MIVLLPNSDSVVVVSCSSSMTFIASPKLASPVTFIFFSIFILCVNVFSVN
ncbi:unnamed protein product [Meloidogyne enterolobii]|uniref:Uncharacterized protein n=1 Tax=Meloidogyne enterolobii TaxID=390850 RepID=A0ACB0YVL6_MELEN